MPRLLAQKLSISLPISATFPIPLSKFIPQNQSVSPRSHEVILNTSSSYDKLIFFSRKLTCPTGSASGKASEANSFPKPVKYFTKIIKGLTFLSDFKWNWKYHQFNHFDLTFNSSSSAILNFICSEQEAQRVVGNSHVSVLWLVTSMHALLHTPFSKVGGSRQRTSLEQAEQTVPRLIPRPFLAFHNLYRRLIVFRSWCCFQITYMEQHLNYECSLSVSLAYVTCYNYASTIS